MKGSEKRRVKCSEVKGSEVKGSEEMILGEMSVLSLIYSYVTLCRFCVVNDLIII